MSFRSDIRPMTRQAELVSSGTALILDGLLLLSAP